MTRETLERVVQAAITAASGKSLTQAVKIISDQIDAALAVEELFSVTLPEEGPNKNVTESPASIIRATESNRLSELAPIGPQLVPSSKPTTYREFYDIGNLQAEVHAAPETILVSPSGYEQPIEMRRSITLMPTDPAGVQLAYKIPGADSELPFPKEFFWITDQGVDLDKAIKKIMSDAALMYAKRTSPIVSRPVVMAPVETRMNSAGTVTWTEKG